MSFKSRFLFVFLTSLTILFQRCAQVVPLTGGERDTKPPVLLSVVPANRSVNVDPARVKIVFKFDEFISVQNISQKLIINPSVPELPEVNVSGKTLTVSFEKELLPNTTYFLQFGNAIVDIHEANPYPELSFMFSTGSVIDSAYVTGSITDALWQKPIADASVMLYKNAADSAPLLLKPDYFTRTDEKGHYLLGAIKPGAYRLFAMVDKNKNGFYDLSEMAGFKTGVTEIKNDTINLALSKALPEKAFIKKKIQPFWGLNRYVLNDTLPNAYIITEKAIDTDQYQYETRNDTLEVYYKKLYSRRFDCVFKNGMVSFDTVSVNIPAKEVVDSSLLAGTAKIKMRPMRNVYGAVHDEVIFDFSLPVSVIKPDLCRLAAGKEEVPVKFSVERANPEGNLVTTYLPLFKRRLVSSLAPGKEYTFVMLPGAMQTFWGTSNTDTLKAAFKTWAADEVGNLQLKFEPPAGSGSYLLQLLNEKGMLVKEYRTAAKDEITHVFYDLVPGEYKLRFIKDADQNGIFSPASYFFSRQAEEVYYYNKPLKIPAGWDVEAEWKMNLPEKK